jgi:hypothetical protein
MDIFDEMFEPAGSGESSKTTVLSAPKTPDRLLKTVDGVVPPPDWPAGHIAPPVPYDPNRHGNGRFAPNNNANPKGRPASFAQLVRHYSADGVELNAFAFGILRGEITNTLSGVTNGEPWENEVPVSAALRWEACKWLKDQGFGKEVARIDVTSNGETVSGSPATADLGPDLSKLTTEEVRTYLALRKKTLAQPQIVDAIADAEIVK